MSLEISQVVVNKIEVKPNIVGFAKVTFGGCFVIDGCKIINGSNGLFVGMPSRKNKKEEYQDICFPITKEFRKELHAAILDEYSKEGGGSSSGSSKSSSSNSDDPF